MNLITQKVRHLQGPANQCKVLSEINLCTVIIQVPEKITCLSVAALDNTAFLSYLTMTKEFCITDWAMTPITSQGINKQLNLLKVQEEVGISRHLQSISTDFDIYKLFENCGFFYGCPSI